MAKDYFYFAASLPMLQFDQEPPFTVEKYLDDCETLLSQDDAEFIKLLIADEDEPLPAHLIKYDFIFQVNRSYQNMLAGFRAQRAGKDPADYVRGDASFNTAVNELIHQAGKYDNLLAAEKILDKAKWQLLDDMAAGHAFGIEHFAAYGLQLKILQRYAEINSSKGAELFGEYKKIGMPDESKQ